jgi:hypothetical protein
MPPVEWFRAIVICDRLPPYSAEVTGRDANGWVRPRFTVEVIAFLQRGKDELVRYLGQYRIDPDLPFVRADAAADPRRPHQTRSVLVFRLLALDGPPKGISRVAPAAHERELRRAPVGAPPYENHDPGQRMAARLLRGYEAYARWARQSELTGFRIRAPQTVTDLKIDLFDLTYHELVVVRPTTARPAVWTALGELHDVARSFDPEPRLVLLVPSRPSDDLTALLLIERVAVVWPDGPGAFSRIGL